MSLFDFYMYLKHIELSQENLEFYMWYVRRHISIAVAHAMTIRFQNYQARYKKEMGAFHSRSEESSFARAPTASATDLDSLDTPTLKEAPSFISKTESQLELVDDETSMSH